MIRVDPFVILILAVIGLSLGMIALLMILMDKPR